MPSTVVAYTTKKRLPPRRGTNAAEIGTTLYAIKHGGVYFIWSYTDRAYAERVAARIAPRDATDIACNWRRSLDRLVHSGRSHD